MSGSGLNDDAAGVERKLTTIVAVDAEGFSKLMGENETLTLETLKACRTIIDEVVQNHHGRIFGGAGDSLLAEFASPVQAVLAAAEFQQLLAERNEHPETPLRMRFRTGINMGDVIIEGGNLYGDGVNVAARLEGVARPGGVCIAAKVHEEVRRKIDLAFSFRGLQELKNIDEPVGIYCLSTADDPAGADEALPPGAVHLDPAAAAAPRPAHERPVVAIHPIKVISGDNETQGLAAGLDEDINGGLTTQTAIEVAAVGAAEKAADYVLEGSIRASGKRVRLSFTLTDMTAGAQIWSERYDRTLDDVFELQDEITRAVTYSVRVRVKQRIFERLKEADDQDLSTPELLDKAAGYFVSGYEHNMDAAAALRLAIEREPENSMALAMLAAALLRHAEFSALALPAELAAEIRQTAKEAVRYGPESYFARLMEGIVLYEVDGRLQDAQDQTESALERNANLVPALAMAVICRTHGGDVEGGLAEMTELEVASRTDPNRYRLMREIAVGHFMAGDDAAACRTVSRLIDGAPGLKRNWMIGAAIHMAAGDEAVAKELVARLLEAEPQLTLATMRPTVMGNAAAAERFREALLAAGLPAK